MTSDLIRVKQEKLAEEYRRKENIALCAWESREKTSGTSVYHNPSLEDLQQDLLRKQRGALGIFFTLAIYEGSNTKGLKVVRQAADNLEDGKEVNLKRLLE